jgi:hypothetical protein
MPGWRSAEILLSPRSGDEPPQLCSIIPPGLLFSRTSGLGPLAQKVWPARIAVPVGGSRRGWRIFLRKEEGQLDEIVFVEGPVIKLCGELVILVALTTECSGIASSSDLSECMKFVIPRGVAETLRIEVGDMVCLRAVEGRFRLEAVKAGILN